MDKTLPFGSLLREWREKKRISQLELSLRTEISTRHISFLETGRATPSKDTVMQLGTALGVPMCIQNLLLLAAGYNSMYQNSDLHSPVLSPVHQAITRILEKHEPYPALVLSKTYAILFINRSLEKLCRSLGYTVQLKTNYLDFLFGDHGFCEVIENRESLARSMLHRLKQEFYASHNEHIQKLYTGLKQKYPLPHADSPDDGYTNAPVLNVRISTGQLTLSLFSVISSLGTPYNMTLEELKVDTMFPSDDITRNFFEHP